MISDKKVEHALDILMDKDHEGAAARAASEHLDDLTKTILAKLTMEAEGKSMAEREMKARSHPDFVTHLEQLRECRRIDYTWRDRRSAASAIIDMWRTEQSNIRASEKVR